MSKVTECPRCKGEMPLDGMQGVSISRRDGSTRICARCGTEEAFIDGGLILPMNTYGRRMIERDIQFKLKVRETPDLRR